MMQMENNLDYSFGPVPSRRLGRSLGINNIPKKFCSYSCVYCQIGKNTCLSIERQVFYDPGRIFSCVQQRVNAARLKGDQINYLAFVPDGEPTLDINLGSEIKALKQLGIPIAVITNASMLWQDDVTRELQNADLVSLKVDAYTEKTWKKINMPCKNLDIKKILESIETFSMDFSGKIITETMILDSVDYHDDLETIPSFLGTIANLEKAYISIPTRPPMEPWVKPANQDMLKTVFNKFSEVLGFDRVELLNQYEGNSFSCLGDVEKGLLEIIAVHPMREDAALAYMAKAGLSRGRLKVLDAEGKIVRKSYLGHVYLCKKD